MARRLAAIARTSGSNGPEGRLEVLRVLGENTRYAIYLEIARSPRPLATTEVAESLGLHPNTVRPHLERMREVGLLELEAHVRGVGRPQHRYSLADDAPSLGLEPATFPLLARLLVRATRAAGVDPQILADVGRDEGRLDAVRSASASCLEGLVDRLDQLGFDPAVVGEDDVATVAFTHCPFGELAAQHPDIVCALHRGMVEGYVEASDGEADIVAFRDVAQRDACQVEVALS